MEKMKKFTLMIRLINNRFYNNFKIILVVKLLQNLWLNKFLLNLYRIKDTFKLILIIL